MHFHSYRRRLVSSFLPPVVPTKHPQNVSLGSLESLIIDEADLILSYGHDEDVHQLFGGGFLPKVFQSFLMSATMTEDVEALKGLVLRNPVSKHAPEILLMLTPLPGNPQA